MVTPKGGADPNAKPGAPNYNTYKGVIPNYSKKRATAAETQKDIGQQRNKIVQKHRKQYPEGYYIAEKRAQARREGRIPKKPGG